MKNKITHVIKYTVEKNIRNKWFIILNLIFLLVSLVALNFGTVKEIFKVNNVSFEKKLNIYVVDSQDMVYQNIENLFKNVKDTQISITKEDVAPVFTKENIDKDTILVEIIYDEIDVVKSKITSKEGIDTKYYSVIETALTNAKYEILETRLDISSDMINKIVQEPIIERIMLGVESEGASQKQILQTIVSYFIFLVLLIVLSKIATDISQEKISKSIEYVLTSINARGYLIAKVMSINITLIIQLLFTFVYALIATTLNSVLRIYFLPEQNMLDSNTINLENIMSLIDGQTVVLLGIMFFYIILTILILSVIQAALSSKTTSISEAGNSTTILVTLNMIIYFVSIFLISPFKEVNIVMNILSCIPIISMYFIPSMMVIGQATTLQIIIASILLIISVPLVFSICSKIFKNGVLDYNNKKRKNQKKVQELSTEEIQMQIITKNHYKKIGFVIGMSILLFIILQFITMYILLPIASTINLGLQYSQMTTIVNMIVFVISLSVPVGFVNLYTEKSNKSREKKKSAKDCVKYILICMPIIFIIQILLGLILEKLGLDYDIIEEVNMYDNTSTLSKILFFVQAALLPAIFEELFIRGSVLNFLKKYGLKFAVIFSSLLFSVIHMNISQAVFAFLLGVMFAIITIKSKSIIPAMILHLLNNGYAALTMIFENTSIISVINIIYVGIILIGICIFIREVFKLTKSRQKFFEALIQKEEEYKKPYKYIFADYTMIVSIIIVSLMIILTQNMLSIL